MSKEEFKFSNKVILLEKKDELNPSYKIRSYKNQFKYIKDNKIPQKDIKEVLNHLFNKNNKISKKTKESISKIIYCPKDRIIIVITKSGQEIIWKRNTLMRNYGWFFFITESDKKSSKKQKDKKKHSNKEEKTILIEVFQFEDNKIALKEKENMRSLYNTKEYLQYFKLIKSKNIPQMPLKGVLNDFFFNKDQKRIPLKEKRAIRKIIYFKKERTIVIKSLIGDKMYENLEFLVKKYGWYFYITGVPVGKSDISIAIDKIEKRFNVNYFNGLSLKYNGNRDQDMRVTIYPIVLKPNHNCHILGLGKFNILLDCGITINNEETEKKRDIQNIEEYLEKLPKFIIEEESKRKKIEEKKISKEEKLEKIDQLRKFEDKKNFKEEALSRTNEEIKTSNLLACKPKIDAIFVSHSHFDHISGLKELIKLYPDVPVLCSRITLDLYLLRDSKFLKQANHENIEEIEYEAVIKNVIYVEHGDKIEFKDKDCYLSFFHAGHMPGALMFMAKVKDFRFLYTGDYTTMDFSPFAGTGKFLEQISRPIDYLLIDGTCAFEEFENISDQLNTLILFLEQKAEYGDNCLIGADPSSLAITFMLMIWRHFRKKQLRKNYQKRPNIYVDMMVRKNIQVINHRYKYIYGPISNLIRDKANPFNSIKFRWFNFDDLDFLRTKNNIIISHPPDLSYGIIRNIINILGRNPHNLVFLSGAIHEQPGLDLISNLEEKMESNEAILQEDQIKNVEIDDKELQIKNNNIDNHFKSYVSLGRDGTPIINYSEKWKTPFRALLLNKFSPNLKIKLHADKKQLTEMIKVLKPKEVCFFHQSPAKLVTAAEHVRNLGVKKVKVSQKRRLKILN
ncbi:MAG: MBL fold metallo-hydrolase [Promethearchaeota archaeon]